MLDSTLLLSAGLVGGGLLVILFTGIAVLRGGMTLYAVGGFLIGAFLIAAPLIKNFNLTKDGVSVETVAAVVKAAGETANDNVTAIVALQSAVAELRKQMEALAAAQTKTSQAAGVPNPLPPDFSKSKEELTRTLDMNDDTVRRILENNRNLQRAVQEFRSR